MSFMGLAPPVLRLRPQSFTEVVMSGHIRGVAGISDGVHGRTILERESAYY